MSSKALREATDERTRRGQGWRTPVESLSEYGRGVAGGLIFSLPLLYTQEVWELGETIEPLRLVVGLCVTVLLLLGYNRYAGLRRDASFAEVLIDSAEELGIGLLIAALILWLIGAIEPGQQPGSALGVVVLEGLLVAVGVSVGTAQLGGGNDDEGMQAGAEGGNDLASQLALGSCGAVLIAANVAPTEEIQLIASAVGAGQLIGLMVLGLVLTTVISFYSDFVGTRRSELPTRREIAQSVATSYSSALLVSAGLLWFFGQLDGLAATPVLACVIVLSVPAALGASAGRLLLQGNQ
jgi:putative integral membrane protein (TIGR02587 family)